MSKKKAILVGSLYEIILDSEDGCGIDKVLLYLSYFDVRARYFGEEENEGLGIG